MLALIIRESDLIYQFRNLSMVCELTLGSAMLGMLKVNNELLNEIRENYKLDVKLVDLLSSVNPNKESDFKVDEHGVLRFQGKLCVLDNFELKKMILDKSHRSNLSIHLGATKMYQNLKKMIWWLGVKRDVDAVCVCMFDLLDIKGRAPETSGFDATIGYSRVEIGYFFNELHDWITEYSKRVWCDMGDC